MVSSVKPSKASTRESCTREIDDSVKDPATNRWRGGPSWLAGMTSATDGFWKASNDSTTMWAFDPPTPNDEIDVTHFPSLAAKSGAICSSYKRSREYNDTSRLES